MPKNPKPSDIDVPSTLERSEEHAQEIYRKTLASAIDSYGEGERARRTAFAAVKHSYEKVGDHWEPKDERGPSDERAGKDTDEARRGEGETHGGVDANASVSHLRDVARRLDISGRSKMNKRELVRAIEKANDRETARARKG